MARSLPAGVAATGGTVARACLRYSSLVTDDTGLILGRVCRDLPARLLEILEPLVASRVSLYPQHSSANLWLGRAGVVAPCHYDGYHNAFAHLHGRFSERRTRGPKAPGPHCPTERNLRHID